MCLLCAASLARACAAAVRQDDRVPGPVQVTPRLVIPEAELSWRFSRSSGPGGQSVNTSDSRVELSFDVARSPSLDEHQRTRALQRLATRLTDGVVTVAASEQRSQLQNREEAERKLAQLLREALAPPPPPRRATRPTRASKERRLQVKRQRSELKRTRRTRHDD
jgi:ribosome-associated protein